MSPDDREKELKKHADKHKSQKFNGIASAVTFFSVVRPRIAVAVLPGPLSQELRLHLHAPPGAARVPNIGSA